MCTHCSFIHLCSHPFVAIVTTLADYWTGWNGVLLDSSSFLAPHSAGMAGEEPVPWARDAWWLVRIRGAARSFPELAAPKADGFSTVIYSPSITILNRRAGSTGKHHHWALIIIGYRGAAPKIRQGGGQKTDTWFGNIAEQVCSISLLASGDEKRDGKRRSGSRGRKREQMHQKI